MTTHRGRSAAHKKKSEEVSADGPDGKESLQQESPQDHDSLQAAGEMVDRFTNWVGRGAANLGLAILRLASRAREEAEDMWVEAEAISRRGQPPASGSSHS